MGQYLKLETSWGHLETFSRGKWYRNKPSEMPMPSKQIEKLPAQRRGGREAGKWKFCAVMEVTKRKCSRKERGVNCSDVSNRSGNRSDYGIGQESGHWWPDKTVPVKLWSQAPWERTRWEWMVKKQKRWWTSSRIRWRHTAPLQIIMWCSFHWYLFTCIYLFHKQHQAWDWRRSPLTSCTRWASSSPVSSSGGLGPTPLTQLLPSLPGLSSLGTAPGERCHTHPVCPRELLVKVFLLIIYSIATERRLRKYAYNVPHPSLWCLTDSNPIFSLVPHKRWLRESI